MNATSPVPAGVKVSVVMITYNHERYIAQAIESVFMQKAGFEFELVIGEDCSTDSTRAIVSAYGERHPERIRLLLPERNQGMMANFVATLAACRGQYVALCDGDDYWTDPLKLQKQVDFLEAHPECSLCYHNVMRFYEDPAIKPTPVVPANQKPFLSIEDIVFRNPLPTSSVMFRNGLLGDMPAWYHDLGVGDWPLWVLVARHGKAGYLNEIMAAYRVHSGGVYSGTPPLEWLPRMLQAYDAIDRGLDFEYHDIVKQGKLKYVIEMAEALCPWFFVDTSPRNAAQVLDPLKQYADLDPHLMSKLRRQFYKAWFFRAAELGDSRAVRQSLLWFALYDRSCLRSRGVRSIAARAFLGQGFTDRLRRLAQAVTLLPGE